MSDRTVTYVFRGNFTSLTAGLAASGRGVADLGAKLTAADRKGAQYRRGLTSLGSTAGKFGLVAAAGIAVMVKATADFDQAMSNVNATGAVTIAQLGEMRNAALQAGQTTKFSATEAAGGIEALLKAGVSASDVIGGALSGSLSLAAAGQLDVASAAEVAATAMTEFKLSGSDVPHIADLIAAGAGKAQGDVSDMAEALKAGGLTAAQFGVSLDDTVGTLTAFAAAGLLGSTSGTVMKQMLLKLAAPSVKAADTMDALGISAYDASGKFVGFTALAGELQSQLSTLAPEQRNAALATIFGSRAIQGANVLYADGAAGLEDYNKKVEDQGYAAKVAAARLDNLSGDLHKFKSALDVAFIGQGEGTQGPLRNLVQGATEVTNAFNKLPTSVHSSVNALLTLTAITGGGVWFTAKAIGAVGSMNSALKNLGVSAESSSKALKAIGLTLVSLEAAGQGIQAIINATREALPGTQTLTQQLLSLTTEIQTMSNTVGAAQLDSKFDDLSTSINRISDPGTLTSLSDHAAAISNVATSIIGLHAQAHGLTEAKDEINALDAALANIASTGSVDQAKAAFAALATSQGLSKDQQAELIKLMPQYREALAGVSNEATLAAGGNDQLATSEKAAADAADAQFKAINNANQAMRDQRDAALGAFDAETQYRQALKDATAQAKKSDAGIKGNTDAALANRGALSQLASAWNNQSASVKNNVSRYKDARKSFIDTAEAMHVPQKAAEALAKQLLDIPRSTVAKVTQQGAEDATSKTKTLFDKVAAVDAQRATAHIAVDPGNSFSIIGTIRADLANIHDKTVTVTTRRVGGGLGPTGSADGGSVPKDSKPYGDRYAYMLAPGEEIISNRYGQADQFRADRAAGRIPGYADGGTTGSRPKSGGSHSYTDLLAADLIHDLGGAAHVASLSLHEFVKQMSELDKQLTRKLKRDEKELSKAQTADQTAHSNLDSLSSTIASSLGMDSIYTKSQASSNPWSTGASGGTFNIAGNANKVAATANTFVANIKALQAKGVTGAALQALISQGPEVLAAVAAMSASDLSSTVSAITAASAAVATASSYGGSAVFGGAVASADAHLDAIRDEVRKLRQDVKAADAANKAGHKATTHAAEHSGSNAAGAARRRGRGH